MRIPGSTYRVQLNPSFRFEDARRAIPYLRDLGITDLYTSPVAKARRGSAHGYDVTDPTTLNPELGTARAFERMAGSLRSRGMGLLLDVVPNHMAMSSENAWWMDVLENGPSSRYASYFDIDWTAPGLVGKVLVPILAAPYAEVLEKGEIGLTLDRDGFFLTYADHRLPVDPKTYHRVLGPGLDDLVERLGRGHPAVRRVGALLRTVERLPGRGDGHGDAADRRARGAASLKRRLWALHRSIREGRAFLQSTLESFADPGSERSFDMLDALIGDQAYLLSYWRVAPQEVDYRRFFDISDLVSVRTQDPEVFETTNRLAVSLFRAGHVTGLRVDHVDGLEDPRRYLERLQARLSAGPAASGREGEGPALERPVDPGDLPGYVVVEKILAEEETLPEDWPCAGTTGYDFLNDLNGIFVDPAGVEALGEVAARFTGREVAFDELVHDEKRKVMEQLFASEVTALGTRLQHLARRDRHGRDLTLGELSRALTEVTAALPVYRTYLSGPRHSAADGDRIEHAVRTASRRSGPELGPALDFLRRVLLLDLPPARPTGKARAWRDFVMRWQQFTGPVTAKGYEDTALYRYVRLVSRNEVGGDPGSAGVTVEEFHRRNRARLRRWPHTMNATSTHDTKRGEDARARINVLSEMPEEWGRRVERWRRLNRRRTRTIQGQRVPDPDEELLLYQTLVGAWPPAGDDEGSFRERILDYVRKAAREAKVHTSWIDQNLAYERALERFVTSVLSRSNRGFRRDVLEFVETVAWYGTLNGLSQVLLKAVSPGVPDFYQGSELWDLSLVDPDNRRPVDFGVRRRLLREVRAASRRDRAALCERLLDAWRDGRVKLYVTATVLGVRADRAEVFSEGSYLPLQASGERAENVCALARRLEGRWVVAVAPRLTSRLGPAGTPPLGRRVWHDTSIRLARGAPEAWTEAFTGQALGVSTEGGEPAIPLAEVLGRFPLALLVGDADG